MTWNRSRKHHRRQLGQLVWRLSIEESIDRSFKSALWDNTQSYCMQRYVHFHSMLLGTANPFLLSPWPACLPAYENNQTTTNAHSCNLRTSTTKLQGMLPSSTSSCSIWPELTASFPEHELKQYIHITHHNRTTQSSALAPRAPTRFIVEDIGGNTGDTGYLDSGDINSWVCTFMTFWLYTIMSLAYSRSTMIYVAYLSFDFGT